MSRFRETVPTALAGGLAAVLLLAGPGWAQPGGDDAVGVVEDLYFIVESLDGSESVEREDTTVTVTLTSDVLFEFDRADLTQEARERLAEVAEDIRADGAGGTVTIAGHTDDQGSDSYNQDLSEERAESVRRELAQRLHDVDVQFETVGYGESEPRVPNLVDGQPNEENRAKNRRVEITYDVQR